MLFYEPKRAEDITAATIRNVILCHGTDHQRRNVLNVEVIWWKKAINSYVQMIIAGMYVINNI